MTDNMRLLRYNTGTDKKVLVKFKNDFSAVIFNATIVAYSKSAVADLVAVHKNHYIIDPQTHIYQQKLEDVQAKDKLGNAILKKSVDKYLDELPSKLKLLFLSKGGSLSTKDIAPFIEELSEKVYLFDSQYVNSYLQGKEYDKYLKYANVGPIPEVIIAPYFMIKSSYSQKEIEEWLNINQQSAYSFIEKNSGKFPVAVQIVLERELLNRDNIVEIIKRAYEHIPVEYAFIWIDDFNLFDATFIQKRNFKDLLLFLNECNIKPVMAYGGYDSIILCSKDLKYRMYGVAQSVGYGENRPITPVGGGLPVNKYYFPPLHTRMKMSEVAGVLANKGYFAMDKYEASERFYREICNCRQCREVIGNDINGFDKYDESKPFDLRNGIKRNRPTSEASLIAAIHFMYSKISEWESVESTSFIELKNSLIEGYRSFSDDNEAKILEWCQVYG